MNLQELAYFIDACRRGDVNETEQLCALFPHLINEKDAKGFTPLIIAVYNNHEQVTQLLLDKGVEINAQDAAGNTALMGACFKGYTELATILIKRGAEVNLCNYQGAPALTFAATFGQLKIAEVLLQHGAQINLKDTRGKTSLDHAVLQENEAMITLLNSYGSNQPI